MADMVKQFMDVLEEFENNGIYYRHANDEIPNAEEFLFHVHDRCEIFYFVSGKAQYLVEGSVYPLEAGSLLIMRPNEAHCVHIFSTERYERFAINFPFCLFDSFDPERRLMKPFFDRPLGKGNMYTLPGLDKTFQAMAQGVDEYEKHISLVTTLIKLVNMINHEYAGHKIEVSHRNTLSENLISYINEHLFEHLTIDILSKHFSLSNSQLRRIFKQSTGATVWEYITAKRLEAAKVMLSGGSPANIAALQCGFNDYSSFYRAYIKRFGNSPTGNTTSQSSP